MLCSMGEPNVDASADRARRAWVSALEAHVPAAEAHVRAADLHAQAGQHPERRQAELTRLDEERREFETEKARHPEWSDHAPDWPTLDLAAEDAWTDSYTTPRASLSKATAPRFRSRRDGRELGHARRSRQRPSDSPGLSRGPDVNDRHDKQHASGGRGGPRDRNHRLRRLPLSSSLRSLKMTRPPRGQSRPAHVGHYLGSARAGTAARYHQRRPRAGRSLSQDTIRTRAEKAPRSMQPPDGSSDTALARRSDLGEDHRTKGMTTLHHRSH